MKSIIKNISIFFLVCYLISCDYSQEEIIKDINVVYFIRHSESPIAIDCGMLYYESGFVDTITINSKDLLSKINELLFDLDTLIPQPQFTPDIRIQCLINYKNKSSEKICFGEFGTTIFNGIWMVDNDTLTYLIKKSINYYETYEPKKFLNNMPEYVEFNKRL